MWVTKLIHKYFPWVNQKKEKKNYFPWARRELVFFATTFFFFFLCCLRAQLCCGTYLSVWFLWNFEKKQGVNGHLCPRLRNVHFERMDRNGQTPQNPVISNKGIRGAAEVRNFIRLFAISSPNQNYSYRTVSMPLSLCFQFT